MLGSRRRTKEGKRKGREEVRVGFCTGKFSEGARGKVSGELRGGRFNGVWRGRGREIGKVLFIKVFSGFTKGIYMEIIAGVIGHGLGSSGG